MNERIKELAEQATQHALFDNGAMAFSVWKQRYTEKLAELIIEACVTQCEQVATDALEMKNSMFVTDAGKTLHSGMWGGAQNCAVGIRKRFLADSNAGDEFDDVIEHTTGTKSPAASDVTQHNWIEP